jgi:3-oxoacyl-(acyl-carrier-protein) synthase/acyl carrier protein
MSDTSDSDVGAVAIVGVAGRFPGAADVDALWSLVARGETAIRSVDEELLREEGVDPAVLRDANYVARAAWLDDADKFDAAFFGFAPKEAVELDPQQRLLLETAYHALESAGYSPRDLRVPVGVYVGTKRSTYYLNNLAPYMDPAASLEHFRAEVAADKGFAPARIAYALNLSGPVLSVDSSCSSALAAVHLACRALVGYECDLALAGGASITFPQRVGYHYHEGGALSPDGECRSFDAGANGTVLGSGVGIVVLKRLADAVADADNILAVVRGTAISNDGARKVGFWAPGVRGQTQAILAAQQVAGVSADDITYVEAHGTGTAMGDSVEIAGLSDAFGLTTDKRNYCALTSSKPNIGHLEGASGVASLIKLVMAHAHAQIPPSIGGTTAKTDIDWANSPFYVSRRLAQWRPGASGRRIGAVSAFGIGGTNVHAIVEQPPRRPAQSATRQTQLWPISAQSGAQCEQMMQTLVAHAERTQADIGDVAYTLQTGRERFSYRGFMVVTAQETTTDEQGAARTVRDVAPIEKDQGTPQLALLLSSDPSARPGWSQPLYEADAGFRAELDACFAELRRALVLPSALSWQEATRLESLGVEAAPPLAFVEQYALARHLEALGIRGSVLVGHGTGEYVAACMAEMLTLPDALSALARLGACAGESTSELHAATLRAPQRALVSASTGSDAINALPRPSGRPALLAEALATARQKGARLLLRVGPVDASARAAIGRVFRAEHCVSLGAVDATVGVSSVLEALGVLWQHGVEPDWRALHSGQERRRVRLPGYAFSRTRYWSSPAAMRTVTKPLPYMASAPRSILADDRHRPPATKIERALARIWCEALGHERIGLDDNFFALGGHSLIAAQIIARIRGELDAELTFDVLFEHATIGSLAAYVAEKRFVRDLTQLPPLVPRGDAPAVPSLAQERLWLAERIEPTSGVYNEGFALRIEGNLDAEALRSALRALVGRHEVLRSAFPTDGGRPSVTMTNVPATLLKHINAGLDDRQLTIERALTSIDNESQRPFDLARGPLLRCVLLSLREDLHVLGFFVHHLTADGLSMAIACRDLAALYEAERERRPAVLPALPVQYADFAVWQRQCTAQRQLLADIDFWREQLHGAKAMELAERAGDRRIRKGEVHRFALPLALMHEVRELAKRLRTTPFCVLLACFVLLLAARSGKRDVVVTTPVTERNRPELDGLIGFFVNSLVLRQAIQEAWSLDELVTAVHATHKSALAHQAVPFEQVVDVVAGAADRAAATAMLGEARFVYLDGATERVDFGNAVATPLPLKRRLAKFALLLTVQCGATQCRADLEYRTELFTRPYIEVFAAELVRLVERVVKVPELRIGTALEDLRGTRVEAAAHGPPIDERRRAAGVPFRSVLEEQDV